ncbi:MAG: hypothetical protein JO051_09040 [Acidobacteriaceae bacterium]|nr:hypothetical protein [Acidobacteriaceae bacterium]
MAEKIPQTKQNYVRYDPAFHFFLAPVLGFLLVWMIAQDIRNPGATATLLVIMVFVMVVMTLRFRMYSLKVQDRVIRLEERLRLGMLLPESLRPRIGELTEKQLVALRFASDAELPVLVERVFRENLAPKQIREAIQSWRPDYWRV